MYPVVALHPSFRLRRTGSNNANLQAFAHAPKLRCRRLSSQSLFLRRLTLIDILPIGVQRARGTPYFSIQDRSIPTAAQIVSCSPKRESSHLAVPSPQSAAAVPAASGALSVFAPGSTIPPPTSNDAASPRPLPAHPHPLNVPLPVWVQTAPVPFPNTSRESTAAPFAGISWASRGSNFFPRCGAATLWLLLRDSAATVSSPADNSAPTSSLRLPASTSGLSLAPEPLLGEVLSCSSLSSSTGPPQEVAV